MKIIDSLKINYFNNQIPPFTYRLKKKEISSHPCFNCLREIDLAIQKGYWKKFPKPIYYWYEMCNAENEEIKKLVKSIKPKKILELGFGSGRIINSLLKMNYKNEIYSVDKDKKIFEITKPFFNKHKNVHLMNKDIKDVLNKENHFDLIVCMMNTFGNIDNSDLIKLIVQKSNNFVFTTYDKKYYKLRKKIYEDRGHKDFFEDKGIYYFNDCWIKGLKSKSYSKKELKEICAFTGKKYEIKKISKLLFMVRIYN